MPENLPDTLGDLYLGGGSVVIDTWPANLPASLRLLYLIGSGITTLPENLPAGLQELRLEWTSLTTAPQNVPVAVRNDVVSELVWCYRRLPQLDRDRLRERPMNELTRQALDSFDELARRDSEFFMRRTVEQPQNQLQQALNISNQTYQNHVSNQTSARYSLQGGIKEIFESQKPNDEQLNSIHSSIEQNYKTLTSNHGMSTGDITIFLTEGRDCISLQDFYGTDQSEWCLLNQGGNKYNLITVSTAEDLMLSGNRHPFIQRDLVTGDIIRGQALLDLLVL